MMKTPIPNIKFSSRYDVRKYSYTQLKLSWADGLTWSLMYICTTLHKHHKDHFSWGYINLKRVFLFLAAANICTVTALFQWLYTIKGPRSPIAHLDKIIHPKLSKAPPTEALVYPWGLDCEKCACTFSNCNQLLNSPFPNKNYNGAKQLNLM